MFRYASVILTVSIVLFLLLSVPLFAQHDVGWKPVYDGYSNEHFFGVWGSADDNIFAVGSNGLVVHFDGISWQYMDAGTSNDLRGVWGIDQNHVYAFGERIILKFDGQSWVNMFGSYLQTGETFNGVWGANPDDLWAVSSHGLVWHFDGNRWSVPVFAAPEGGDFYAIWGTSADNIYAGGTSQPLFHYDGVAWSSLSIRTKENPEGRWEIYDIWGTGADNVYAGPLHYDGTDWMPTSNVGNRGIWGNDANDVYSIGTIDASGGYAYIRHYTGEHWQETVGTTSRNLDGSLNTLNDMWGSDHDNVYAVGRGGVILRGPRFDIHIHHHGDGVGEVVFQGTDVRCVSDCFVTFDRGELIQIDALPDDSANFDMWSGDCTGQGTCPLVVNTVQTITATFSVKTFELAVIRSGTGSGEVVQISASTPETIACGLQCEATYRYGEIVSLIARPDIRSSFVGWSGDCVGVDSCNIEMTSNRIISATFEALDMIFLPVVKLR